MKNYDGQSRNPISPITISHCLKWGENAQVMALSAKPENPSSDRSGAGQPSGQNSAPSAGFSFAVSHVLISASYKHGYIDMRCKPYKHVNEVA